MPTYDTLDDYERNSEAKYRNRPPSDYRNQEASAKQDLINTIVDPVLFTHRILDVDLWGVQRDILHALNTPNARVAVRACHASGKALTLDTPIPTPTGWTTMGEIKVGDLVYNEDGQSVPVIVISPIQIKPCSVVRFSDGSEITASDDHLWNAIDLHHRPRKVRDWRDHWASTQTISTSRLQLTTHADRQLRWRVPTSRAVEGSVAWDFPIAPYTYGAWLGDGTLVRFEVTCGEADLVYMHSRLGGTIKRQANRAPRIILSAHPYTDAPSRFTNGTKRIPPHLLRAPIHDRIELLRGLMDTDGYITSGSGVEIALSDQDLASDVRDLILSLGLIASFCEKPTSHRPSYRIAFSPDFCPFHLPRKVMSWKVRSRQASRFTQRTITSVTPAGNHPVRCIGVDSPRHLYLAGRSYIPTHNTFTAGNGVVWFGVRYPDAIIPSTAPTWKQVKDLLWKEIDTAVKRAKIILPPVHTTDWKFSRDHYATGLSTKETERFQGFHSGHVLIVIDEAPGVAEEIWTAIEGIESGGDVRILALGNPTITSGRFYNAFNRNRGQWKTFTIDAFETPNFIDLPGKDWEEKLEYLAWAETNDSDILAANPNPYLTTRKWVLDRSRDWGITSPLWTARVRGVFPSQASTSLIALDWVERATTTTPIPGSHILSCDVARFGMNFTAYCEMFGNEVNRMWKYQKRDTVSTFNELRSYYRRDPKLVIIVDDSGVGGGVVDMLRDANIPVIAFNAGSEATYNDEALNRGSEAYWNLSLSLRDEEVALSPELPDQIKEELTQQLVQIEYKFTLKNKIQVMKTGLKDDLPSPDLADTLNLAWAAHHLDHLNPALTSLSISPGQLPPAQTGPGPGASTSYSWRDRGGRLFGVGGGLGMNRGGGSGGGAQVFRSNELSMDPELLQGSVTGALIMLCPSCGKIAGLRELGKSDGERHYQLDCGGCGHSKIISTPVQKT